MVKFPKVLGKIENVQYYYYHPYIYIFTLYVVSVKCHRLSFISTVPFFIIKMCNVRSKFDVMDFLKISFQFCRLNFRPSLQCCCCRPLKFDGWQSHNALRLCRRARCHGCPLVTLCICFSVKL